jgi:hypothetical protein
MQLSVRLPQTIEAIQIILDGHDYYAIPRDVLEALYEQSPVCRDATPAPRKRRAPKATKAGRKPRRAATPVEIAPAGSATVAEQVLTALRKRPMTSGELIEQIKSHPSAVYGALKNLRTDKKVETREDPTDAQRKNYLVEAA